MTHLCSVKSITIHKIDHDLEKRLTELAQESGLSLNQLVKNLLRERLGLESVTVADHRSEFAEFCGQWTQEEADQFNQSVSWTSAVWK